MIKAIIFDLDGTLINLPTDYKIVKKKLNDYFKTDNDFSPLIPSIIKEANKNKLKIEKAFEIICEQEMIAVKNFQRKPNIEKIMIFLKQENCTICLVTMQCRKAAIKILTELGITDLFSNILTRNESYDRLDQIEKTLKKMKFEPGRTLFIGDTGHDIECARKIGCQYRRMTNYSDIKAKTIKDLSEIKGLINK